MHAQPRGGVERTSPTPPRAAAGSRSDAGTSGCETQASIARWPRPRTTRGCGSRERRPIGGARILSRRACICMRARRPRSGADSGGARPRRVGAPLDEVCFQAEPESAMCVQNHDDSLNSAIRVSYRGSLRSSSLREPRYPSVTLVWFWLGALAGARRRAWHRSPLRRSGGATARKGAPR